MLIKQNTILTGTISAGMTLIISWFFSSCNPSASEDDYYPPPEINGGWRTVRPVLLGLDTAKLAMAVNWHNTHEYTAEKGGALLIVYKGYMIAEHYITGVQGGPQPWTALTCNDIKSSTKSVFGTAAGVFLEEFKDQVSLETRFIGTSRERSLIPQIWEQPITDERKTRIKVKHALSMTSGHANAEPWFAPGIRKHTPGYSGPFQMYEYCFGWWSFEEANFQVDSHVRLLFEPGTEFRYSNFGLELVSLAIKNVSGELTGPYVYDRVLGPIGLPLEVRENQYKDIPYKANQRPLKRLWDGDAENFSMHPGWGVGGGPDCDAYGADRSPSLYGPNTLAGSTLRISLRDFARIAYLWLQKGQWQNSQLVPQAWIEQATSSYVRDNGETPMGYGYTFWIQDEWPGVPEDLFMACGDRCNDAFVIPSLDLVVVRQGNKNPDDRMTARRILIQKIVQSIPKSELVVRSIK
jgi:CubicO group peptidase (beta-lactamase class C family)